MDTIEMLRTFVRVVETGSFTVVAREMNANQSKVSRQITQLEEHFGVAATASNNTPSQPDR